MTSSTKMADTIERLEIELDVARRERDAMRKAGDTWERVGIDARTAERRARADLEIERGNVTARAIEYSRAVVAGIAGAMGLDTSGEGDEIHARILAEHARLVGAVAAERARCAARVRDTLHRTDGLKSTPMLRAITAALGDALRGIESGDTGADGDVVLTAVTRLTRERDEARAAIAADLHCDECEAWATRRIAVARATGRPAATAYACDAHSSPPDADGSDWQDLPHAAAVRAAQVTT